MSITSEEDRVAELARQVVRDHDPKFVPIPDHLGACYDAGLSWVHFPEGLGGLGVSRGLQGAGGPVPLGLNPMGYGMAAPTLREHAQTDEVKQKLLLGGIGFTWEHQTHLYFKRATTDAALLGTAEAHRDRVAAMVLDTASADRAPRVATGAPA